MDMNLTKTELRAHQIWATLLLAARNRQTITYKMLGISVGGITPRGLYDMLAVVAEYCEEKKYPPLTVIVVEGHTGRPSAKSGFDDPDQILKDFQRVFSHDWEKTLKKDKHPSVEDFRRIWKTMRDKR